MLIDLDKFELFWLLESVARGSHLRQDMWRKFVDIFFHKMTPSEIRFLRDQCAEKLSNLYPDEKSVGYEDFQKFLARYDIDNNLYKVIVRYPRGAKRREIIAYKFDDKYAVSLNRFVNSDYIIEGELINTSDIENFELSRFISKTYGII